MGGALFIGSFFYALLIMTLYLLIFSEYEALRLASYERYMGTYLAGFSVFVLAAFLYEARFLRAVYKKYSSLLILLLFFASVGLGFAISRSTQEGEVLYAVAHARQDVSTTINIRTPYEVAKQWKPCLDNPNDRLNIVATNTKGNERNILLYTLYPMAAQTNYSFDFSVGQKPYDAADIWTMVVTPEGWREYIKSSYTLVYVYKYDEAFSSSYGKYFDTLKDNQLYKVVDVNGNARLRAVNVNTCSLEVK